jgi:hypothetical protein
LNAALWPVAGLGAVATLAVTKAVSGAATKALEASAAQQEDDDDKKGGRP